MSFMAPIIELAWREVPRKIEQTLEKCADQRVVSQVAQTLPYEHFNDLWYNPDAKLYTVNFTKEAGDEDVAAWQSRLAEFGQVDYDFDLDPNKLASRNIKLAFVPDVQKFHEKRAYSPTLDRLGKVTGAFPGVIPGAPNALINTLAGAALLGGTGYGLGWLGEKFLPEDWKRGRLRKTLGFGGALLGALPGAAWMASNVYSGKPFYSGAAFEGNGVTPPPAPLAAPKPDMKEASFFGGQEMPMIDLVNLRNSVWDDPQVVQQVPLPVRAAADGIVTGAAKANHRTRFVSPLDVARMAAGMGSGYVSGALVGAGLGLLTGMPPATQNKLKQTGVWAGALANIVPKFFGG